MLKSNVLLLKSTNLPSWYLNRIFNFCIFSCGGSNITILFKNPFLESNKLLIKHAFDQLNMNRIYGGTLNKDVSRFFTRLLNFKEEGVLINDVYKNGNWNNVYLIGILKGDFN